MIDTPNINNSESNQESSLKKDSSVKVELHKETENFVPEDFKSEPVTYFNEKGVNIKSGEVKYNEDGTVKEDPTAVKDLPNWENSNGEIIPVVGKRINTTKAKVGQSSDPFYEYKILELLEETGLPAPHPIAKAEQNDQYLFVMERVSGIRWQDRIKFLSEKGMSLEDIEKWEEKAKEKMRMLADVFEDFGIKRGWKEADMIFDIDETTGNIKKIIPTDWERTKIDLYTYNEKKNEMAREGLSTGDLLLTPEERIRKIDAEVFETEEEIVKVARKIEETESAIKKVRDNLGLITQNETSPSIEQLKIILEKLREQKEEIERKREKFVKKAEIENALEHEILILLKEKIDEIFERLSKLENIEFEHLALNGYFRNGDQLELSSGLKIPADIIKKLIVAYKEKITDISELLNFIPELMQAKSALREEASKRINNQ